MASIPEDDQPPVTITPISPPPPDTEGDTADEFDYEKYDAGEQSKKLSALFSNRIFVQPDGMHLRISFGERIEEESKFHSAIVVPNVDAVAFGELLVSMAKASLDLQMQHYREAFKTESEEIPIAPSDSADG